MYLDLWNVDTYGKKIVIAKVSQAEDDRCQSVRMSHATELWCQSAPARLFPAIIVCNMKQWPDFPSFGWGMQPAYTFVPTYLSRANT